jgi:hypothetical protein
LVPIALVINSELLHLLCFYISVLGLALGDVKLGLFASLILRIIIS